MMIDLNAKFKGRYTVADGYSGGDRPQYFTIYASDLAVDMTDDELEREYESTMIQHFEEHITPEHDRLPLFIAWARAQLQSAKFAKAAADNRREDERQAAANSIHAPGSARWVEVMDSERGPDIDCDESGE
ncbi:MAG: hypothetical protein ABMA00_15440 [Gemmatimonas sp.]